MMRREEMFRPEIKRTPAWLKNIFELKDPDIEVLAERIRQANGLIRLFVHPYFITAREEQDGFSQAKIEAIVKTIKLLATGDPDRMPPLFIMEGQEKIKDLENNIVASSLEPLANETEINDVFVIPTLAAHTPEPLPRENTRSSNAGRIFKDEDYNDSWSVLIAKLKQLGVEKIFIGGMLMNTVINIQNGRLRGVGCVGTTIENLEHDFNVELSNLSYSAREWSEQARGARKEFQRELKKKSNSL